ncbi:unnamed protein product [Heligmosomoides polygyrus]|uniref:Uncharacterized protein n=1 Tax=Heligmosomoides polygyrus TaxID=6339 RepID=A0A3P7ZU59_HELPZ|nr:unnamed protein product [Heligmosomoides polygyrus]
MFILHRRTMRQIIYALFRLSVKSQRDILPCECKAQPLRGTYLLRFLPFFCPAAVADIYRGLILALLQGEATYAKLMDSSQSLVDFMKKEYQDTRRQ